MNRFLILKQPFVEQLAFSLIITESNSHQCFFSFPVFTLSEPVLSASPSKEVQNGNLVTLNCSVETIKSGNFVLNYTFKIFKYDDLLVNVTSEQEWVVYRIFLARFSHSGEYHCEVHVKGKTKTSRLLPLRVKGKHFFITAYFLAKKCLDPQLAQTAFLRDSDRSHKAQASIWYW